MMPDKLGDAIRSLEHAAKQNENDAKEPCAGRCYCDPCSAKAVAGEQRRMIRILKKLAKETV